MIFYIGYPESSGIKHFDYAMLSYNRIRNRKSYFSPSKKGWMLDSGAFTEISTHGHYRHSAEKYADDINKFSIIKNLDCAVSQDYMCEPFILEKTGLTVLQHQELTIQRYDIIRSIVQDHVHVMPVLQGYLLEDYIQHIDMYGDRLKNNMLVGVGSVCKRNTDPVVIEEIVKKILYTKPTIRLHGFGVKITALKNKTIWESFYSTDSAAWAFQLRIENRSVNSVEEAHAYAAKINSLHSST